MTDTLKAIEATTHNALVLTDSMIAPGQLIIISTLEIDARPFVALKGFNPQEQFTKEQTLTIPPIDSVGDFIDVLCAKGFMTELSATDIFEYCI